MHRRQASPPWKRKAENVFANEPFYRNRRGRNWGRILRLWQKAGQVPVHHGRHRSLRLSISDLKPVLVDFRWASSGGAPFPVEKRRVGADQARVTRTVQTQSMRIPNIIQLLDKSRFRLYILSSHDAGWSSPVAHWAHNPEVVGSNPTPATKSGPGSLRAFYFSSLISIFWRGISIPSSSRTDTTSLLIRFSVSILPRDGFTIAKIL